MSGHTPGPWRAIDKMVVVVAETHGYDGCIVTSSIGGASSVEQRANAKMAAASPELFARLERLVAVIDMAGLLNLSNGVQLGQTSWYVKASDALEAARAAITQATQDQGGESHE